MTVNKLRNVVACCLCIFKMKLSVVNVTEKKLSKTGLCLSQKISCCSA